MRRVTMVDVAEAVGVSTTTVSNAFNRPDQLSDALRTEILATAARLGYAGPDPTARSLRSGRSGVLGVVFTERLSFAFAEPSAVAFLEGVTRAAEAVGVGVLLLPGATEDDEDPTRRSTRGLVEAVVRAAVDGFIVYSIAASDPALEAVRRRGLPTVVVDSPGPPDVTVDDVAGAEAAMRHLLELGHRRLAVLSFRVATDGRHGPVDVQRRRASPYAVTRARFAGYEQALAAARRDDPTVPAWDEVPVHEVGGHAAPGAAAAGARALLDAHADATAVVATGDFLALALLDAAAARGRRIPGQLSVVGFDDVPLAATATPPLTTVHQPSRAKGELAGRALLRALEEDAPAPTLLPTRLVVRGSTAPPSGAERSVAPGSP